MAATAIISYDNTPGDRDALALGRLLRDAGAAVSLAYVRHVQLEDLERETLEEHDAQRLLEEGAQLLGEPATPRHVVLDGSTGEGLIALASRLGADVLVFGSDYRTAPGRVQPGTSARRLLDGGTTAVGIAPAGFRDRQPQITRVRFDGDAGAEQTAHALAEAVGAQVSAAPGQGPADLLVVGSRPEARDGHVLVTAAAQYAIETSSCPVLVVPRGVVLAFGAAPAAAM